MTQVKECRNPCTGDVEGTCLNIDTLLDQRQRVDALCCFLHMDSAGQRSSPSETRSGEDSAHSRSGRLVDVLVVGKRRHLDGRYLTHSVNEVEGRSCIEARI